MSEDQQSKDIFFSRVGALADEMIGVYGQDFAMGVLVLAARWIAEGKSFTKDKPKGEAE